MNAQLVKELALILGYAGVVGTLFVCVLRQITYRITRAHLEIRLFGHALRRIRLTDIKAVSTKPVFFAECWCNSMLAQNRWLVIERYSGVFRNLVISPHYRFVFRSELAEAKRLYAMSLADRPLLVLPRRSILQWIRESLAGLQAQKAMPAMRKGLKACQVPGSILS